RVPSPANCAGSGFQKRLMAELSKPCFRQDASRALGVESLWGQFQIFCELQSRAVRKELALAECHGGFRGAFSKIVVGRARIKRDGLIAGLASDFQLSQIVKRSAAIEVRQGGRGIVYSRLFKQGRGFLVVFQGEESVSFAKKHLPDLLAVLVGARD